MNTPSVEGTVKQFPYRTARVSNDFLRLPRDKTMNALEYKLAEAASGRTDNHTVYMIVQDGKPPVYIMFSDYTVTFAHSVIERDW